LNRDEWKEKGMRGREHMIQNFNEAKLINEWDRVMKEVYNEKSNYKPWKVEVI
jgi:hypothetical protein